MAENNGKQIEDVRKLAIYKICRYKPYLGWKSLLEKSNKMLNSFPDSPRNIAVDNLKHDLRKLVEQGVIGKSRGKTKRKSAYFVTEGAKDAMVPEHLEGWDSAFEEYLKEEKYRRVAEKEHPSSNLVTVRKEHAEKIKKGVEPLKTPLNQWKRNPVLTTGIKTNAGYSFSVKMEIEAMEGKWFFRDLMENHSSEFKEAIEEFKGTTEEYEVLLDKLEKEIDSVLDVKEISERLGLKTSKWSWEWVQITGGEVAEDGDGWRWIVPTLKAWVELAVEYYEQKNCCNPRYIFLNRIAILPNDASYTLYIDGEPALRLDGVHKYFNGEPKYLEELGEVKLVPNNNNVYTFYLDDFPVLMVNKRETGDIPLTEKETKAEGELLADTLEKEIKEYDGYYNLGIVKFRPTRFEGFVKEFCKTVAELLDRKTFAEYAEEFWRLNKKMRESGMNILTVLEELEGYEILPGICKYIYPE